jgi:hypothetical protein
MLKVVFFYTQATRGWTETYYANGSTPATWVQANQALLNNPFDIMNIRATDVILQEIRVSAIGSPRITYSLPLNYQSPNALEDPATTNYDQDSFGTDALLLVRSAAGIPRHIWLRGIPEIYVAYDEEGNPTPPAEFLQRVASFQSALLKLGMMIQNANVPPTGSPLWFTVAFVNANAVGGSPSSVLNVPTLPTMTSPYGQICFQGIPKNDLPGFPRILNPISLNAGTPLATITVPYRYRGSDPETYTPKMKFFVLNYQYNLITTVQFELYSSRKTGRPTNLPRGRAPAVVKRR